MVWFKRALTETLTRVVPYVAPTLEAQCVLYSGAESTGHAAVVLLYLGKVLYAHGRVPNSIRRHLKPRKTNIVAYEMIAAVVAILALDKLVPNTVFARHFVDNTPTKSCVIGGYSKQGGLNTIVGALWYESAHRTLSYRCEYVQSKANLADGPSRRDISVMTRMNAVEFPLEFHRYVSAAESWSSRPCASRMLAR